MMRTKLSLGLSSVALCTIASALALHPRDADACGGVFCDGGPQPMPVDQTGENILFVWEEDYIEAHIQIQYVGEPAKFGWVIPLQGVPEFSVGSEPLFQALLAGSVPTYGYQQTFDDCSLGDDGDQNGSGFDSDSAGGTGAGDSGDPTGPGEGPDILLKETVGAFEITVLQGATGQEVFDWLQENEYQQDEEALPILDEYISEGIIFAAVKLTGGAGIDEIHPIVLRFQGTEPCVPLRLTRIAAVENMGVRSFFLGDARYVPRNYRHVLVNHLKVDWITPTNYNDVITLAVDEENANGRAFVTEYAGASDVIQQGGIFSGSWSAGPFATLEPTAVGAELENQGLIFCDFDFGNGCTFTHPLLEGLLAEYVTPPAGYEAAEYWANQEMFPDVDLTGWDAAAFSAALSDRIIEPGQHAVDLLNQNDYLTRMYTTISPAEMTEDPEFHENPNLPEVPNILNGTLRNLCNGDQVFTLPDGRELYLPAGGGWPELPDEPDGVPGMMPSSEIIEEVPANGAPIRLTDNTERINAVLLAWNEANGWPGIGAGDSAGTAADDSSGGGGGADGEGEGCGCTTEPRGSLAWSVLGLVGLAAMRRRRR
jgi:MYXO-CTERM domain-containing protein